MLFSFFETIISSVTLLLSYISGNSSFPKPLSAKDEQFYIERYKNGDMAARDVLIEHNLRLVAHIAKKYSNSNEDNEDIISIGTIGLIKGITSFDPSKGTRLATYAARCVDNEILMLMRTQKKTQGDVSLSETIGVDKEGNQIMLIDILKSDTADIFDKINTDIQVRQLYENIKSELDERERKVIILRYGIGGTKAYTQREVAKLLNISRSYVSRIEKKAVGKLGKGIKEV
jgi:RNA polymerase sporulation-specific sigma factor